MSDDKSGLAEFWRGEARKARELSAKARLAGDPVLEVTAESSARWLDMKADLADQEYEESKAALARTLARAEERQKKRAHAFGVILSGKHVRGGLA